MSYRLRSFAFSLGALVMAFVAAPALGQVPQDTTFTGRLVDDLGVPLVGPVDLQLRIFDAATGGTQLYSEQHNGTALDTTGGFSVQLGMGTSPSGTFDASLFSEVDRWLEVVSGPQILTPRLIIASVPWAMVAQQAEEIVHPTRFEDCGDGTVADHQTGLQWEKKVGTLGAAVNCGDFEFSCSNLASDVNSHYRWSSDTLYLPDGGAVIGFLATLNYAFKRGDASFPEGGCRAGHCDWRLPIVTELDSIVDCSGGAPCIDPIFGPTGSSDYLTAQDLGAAEPAAPWVVDFANGQTGFGDKLTYTRVRAVRVGSCR